MLLQVDLLFKPGHYDLLRRREDALPVPLQQRLLVRDGGWGGLVVVYEGEGRCMNKGMSA